MMQTICPPLCIHYEDSSLENGNNEQLCLLSLDCSLRHKFYEFCNLEVDVVCSDASVLDR